MAWTQKMVGDVGDNDVYANSSGLDRAGFSCNSQISSVFSAHTTYQ
jgi:hypothetical protein